jgi:hypothetical protein
MELARGSVAAGTRRNGAAPGAGVALDRQRAFRPARRTDRFGDRGGREGIRAASDETSRSALASALLQLSPHLRAGFDVGADAVEAIGWLGEDGVAFVRRRTRRRCRRLRRAARAAVTSGPSGRCRGSNGQATATARRSGRCGRSARTGSWRCLDDGTIALIERGAAAARVATPMRDGANGPVTLQAGTHAAAIGRSGTCWLLPRTVPTSW